MRACASALQFAQCSALALLLLNACHCTGTAPIADADVIQRDDAVAADVPRDILSDVFFAPQTCAAAASAEARAFQCPLIPDPDGRWGRPSCAVPACLLRIAYEPAREVQPLRWRPCASGRAGCTELDIDWTTTFDRVRIKIWRPGFHDGTRGWFWMNRAIGEVGEYTTALISESGPPVFVASYNNSGSVALCIATADDVSPTGALISVNMESPGQLMTALYRGPLRDDPQWRTPRVVFDRVSCSDRFPNDISSSDELIAAEMYPLGTLLRVDRGSTQAVLVARAGDINANPVIPSVIGGDIFFVGDSFGRNLDLWVSHRGAAPMLLVGERAFDVRSVAVDPQNLAWMQGLERNPELRSPLYREVSLWTAPFAIDAASLRPRRVTALPIRDVFNTRPAFGFGRYAFAETRSRFRIVNLVDGTSWHVDADTNTEWTVAAVWLGPDEIALGVHTPGDMPPNIAARQIQRIRFDSLGTPEPALP